MTTRSDSLTFGEKMLQQTAAVWHIPKSCFFLLFFLSNFTFQWIAFGSWVEGISVPQWYCLRKESVCQIWNQIIAVTIIKLRKAALLSPLHLYYIHEVARSQLLQTRGKRIVSSRRYNTHKMLKSSCVPSKIPCVCTFPCALMFPLAWLHANSIVPALLYFLLFRTRLTTLYSKIKAHPPINPQLCHNAGIYCLFGVWNLSNKKNYNKKAFQKLEKNKVISQVVYHPFSKYYYG